MVVFNYLPKSCEISNTTIIIKPLDKSMVLVKDFYLLHFRHSLLPFYIGAPEGRKQAAAQYFVQRPFRQIKRFIMRSAYALRINSGKIIFNLQFWKICGFSRIAFSRVGSWRQTAITAPLSAKARRCGKLARPLRHGIRRATLPLLSLRDIFPRRGGSLSSKGEALAKR